MTQLMLLNDESLTILNSLNLIRCERLTLTVSINTEEISTPSAIGSPKTSSSDVGPRVRESEHNAPRTTERININSPARRVSPLP